MTTYVMRDGKLVEKSSVEAAPTGYVISDIPESFECPATGVAVHSKRQYYQNLAANGFHVSEPGDVAKRQGTSRREVDAAVKQACERLGI